METPTASHRGSSLPRCTQHPPSSHLPDFLFLTMLGPCHSTSPTHTRSLFTGHSFCLQTLSLYLFFPPALKITYLDYKFPSSCRSFSIHSHFWNHCLHSVLLCCSPSSLNSVKHSFCPHRSLGLFFLRDLFPYGMMILILSLYFLSTIFNMFNDSLLSWNCFSHELWQYLFLVFFLIFYNSLCAGFDFPWVLFSICSKI